MHKSIIDLLFDLFTKNMKEHYYVSGNKKFDRNMIIEVNECIAEIVAHRMMIMLIIV